MPYWRAPFSTPPRYKLGARIAKGGQGEVYRATCEVVVKRLIRVDDPHHQARIRREFEAARRIDHPNVVKVLDGDFGATPYIVMEYLRGEALSKRMARSRRSRDVLECVRLLLQAMQGVKELHDHDLIHRDLKPDNIFIRQDCEHEIAVVIDLGVVRFLTRAPPHGRTATGMLIGTYGYMAPEQAAGEPVAHAADIYALGVILYEIFVGALPHDSAEASSRTLAEAIARIDELAAWSSGRSLDDVHVQLTAAIVRALAQDPEERHPSVAAFAIALERAIGLAESTLSPSAATASVSQPMLYPRPVAPRAWRGWSMRFGWRSGALAFTALLLLSIASVSIWSRRPSGAAPVVAAQHPQAEPGPPIAPASPVLRNEPSDLAVRSVAHDPDPPAPVLRNPPPRHKPADRRKQPKPATPVASARTAEPVAETEEEVVRRMRLELANQRQHSLAP